MTAGQVWFIIDVVKLVCYAGFGLLLARMATALLAFILRRDEREKRRYPLRLLALLVLIAVAMGLITCLVGGDYYVPDPTGQTALDYQARGWPLSMVSFGDSPFRWEGATGTATALLCIAVDVAAVLAILVATRYVLDRWLTPSPEASLMRRARDVLLWVLAVGAALAVEPWLSRPLMVPGTEVAFYSTLVHEIWYVRLVVLFGVGCALYAVAHLTVLGWRALRKMRSEGVL